VIFKVGDLVEHENTPGVIWEILEFTETVGNDTPRCWVKFWGALDGAEGVPEPEARDHPHNAFIKSLRLPTNPLVILALSAQ